MPDHAGWPLPEVTSGEIHTAADPTGCAEVSLGAKCSFHCLRQSSFSPFRHNLPFTQNENLLMYVPMGLKGAGMISWIFVLDFSCWRIPLFRASRNNQESVSGPSLCYGISIYQMYHCLKKETWPLKSNSAWFFPLPLQTPSHRSPRCGIYFHIPLKPIISSLFIISNIPF